MRHGSTPLLCDPRGGQSLRLSFEIKIDQQVASRDQRLQLSQPMTGRSVGAVTIHEGKLSRRVVNDDRDADVADLRGLYVREHEPDG